MIGVINITGKDHDEAGGRCIPVTGFFLKNGLFTIVRYNKFLSLASEKIWLRSSTE